MNAYIEETSEGEDILVIEKGSLLSLELRGVGGGEPYDQFYPFDHEDG